MMIPKSVLEPFGVIGIPELVPVRQGVNFEEVTKVFEAIKESFRQARDLWELRKLMESLGHDTSLGRDTPDAVYKLDPKILKLHAVFAGGLEVECNITDMANGFYMSVTFKVKNDPTRYGLSMEYPDGHNANV